MDAFLITLLLCFVAELGDRQQLHAARLGVRFGPSLALSAGLIAAIVVIVVVPAWGALFILPTINPSARLLMLAIALVFAGAGLIQRARAYTGFDRWKLGPLMTAAASMTTLGLSGRSAFLLFGIACWTADPVLSAIGGGAGLALAWLPATARQPDLFQHRTIGVARIVIASALLIWGALAGLSAFRLL